MSEREQIEHAITALETQRAVLGDAVVDVALEPLREKLAALKSREQGQLQRLKYITVLFADVVDSTRMARHSTRRIPTPSWTAR